MATAITSDPLNANIKVCTGLTASENTEAVTLSRGGALAAVSVEGTFGGTVTIQVSNDNTNWFTLNDPLGDAITFTTNGYSEVSTGAAYIRASAGSGVSSVNVRFSIR